MSFKGCVWLLGTVVGILGAIASLIGINAMNATSFLQGEKPLGAEDRTVIAAKVRQITTDASVSIDERAGLQEEITALPVDAAAAERYVAQIEPAMIEAAEEMRHGFRLATTGDYSQARDRFAEATRLDEGNAAAWANLGGAALESGSITEAEVALRRALALDDESVTAHYNLAACLALQKRTEPALDHLARALDLLQHEAGAPVGDYRALLADLRHSPHFDPVRRTARFQDLSRLLDGSN